MTFIEQRREEYLQKIKNELDEEWIDREGFVTVHTPTKNDIEYLRDLLEEVLKTY
jgi:hypothetical protein